MGIPLVEGGMRRLVAAVLMLAAVACAGTGGPAAGDDPVSLDEVTGDPDGYDGERITISGGYYGAFEVSVLTSGFAESYPPQPVEPLVWVGAAPDGPCLQRADAEGRGASWADRVLATGIFEFSADGGFGHLGSYDMQLVEARVRCA